MKGLVPAALMLVSCVAIPLITGCDSIQNVVYKSAVERAIHEDALTGHEATIDHLNAMRAVDLSDCPPDFREAYSHHIHAWEEATRVQQAKARLESDEDSAALAGILATAFESDATPWSDHLQAVNRVDQQQARAEEGIRSTWQAVEDTARKYGARI